MPVRHLCPLCDYARAATHSTVLDPACPVCGSVLASAGPEPRQAPARAVVRLARARWIERVAVGLVVLPVLAAAAKLGWGAAGAAGALGALALGGLVSFVALTPSR